MKFVLLILLMIFNPIQMNLSFSQLQEIRMLSIPKKPEMELLPQDEIRSNWSDFKFERTEKEYNHLKVENYAISEEGKIAILFSGYINVYNPDYSFVYGFLYEHYGDECIEWDGDNLVLFVKSGKALYFDDDGNILKIEKLVNDNHYAEYRYKNYLRRNVKEANTITYELRKKPLISQTLVAVEQNGEEHIIYQSSIWFAIGNIFIVICVISIFTGGIIFITYSSIKKSKEMGSQNVFIYPKVQG